MLGEHAAMDPLDSLRPVSDATEVRSLINAVRRIHVSDGVRRYAVDASRIKAELSQVHGQRPGSKSASDNSSGSRSAV